MKKASEMPGGILGLYVAFLFFSFFLKNKKERENEIEGMYLPSVLIPNV